MSNSLRLFFNLPRAISLAAIFCVLIALAPKVLAQSTRRGLKRSQTLAMKLYIASQPQKDIDLYLGRIVRKDGDYVIVTITSPNVIKDRVPMYYACDKKMMPTAILESPEFKHRSCAVFKTQSGKPLVGDTVMVKYLAPKEEDSTTKNRD